MVVNGIKKGATMEIRDWQRTEKYEVQKCEDLAVGSTLFIYILYIPKSYPIKIRTANVKLAKVDFKKTTLGLDKMSSLSEKDSDVVSSCRDTAIDPHSRV